MAEAAIVAAVALPALELAADLLLAVSTFAVVSTTEAALALALALALVLAGLGALAGDVTRLTAVEAGAAAAA
eukprot:CAMPEP_0177322882 /NCGR_PEP_ID=MMETSP0368-20130122/16446_1 /TAXON_ID=447022 ORGANISM="Scrippsiella hangoei-like, Strain SHHI-4" /NCGR_SAMPLE_ID=MMETSP0368 /ASSEMBLY_ACC=CAM_ASM_000363 /LENGTH=72 /DNA_ID=CAMNT_0018782611 /DNA_START=240 /DNA_END=454 /DNA_ORIENTATION=-